MTFFRNFFLYFVITCIVTFPAIFHVSDKIIGYGGDNYQFLGFQYVANHQVEQGQFPFGWTNYWRYPVGFDFSAAYDSTLLMLTGVALYSFISDPVVVYNFSTLLLLAVNGVLSFYLFRELTTNEWLGFLGGLLYGFSFYVIARAAGHTNLIVTGVFPFFVYSLIGLYKENGSWKHFFLFGISIVLTFLASLQYFLLLIGSP